MRKKRKNQKSKTGERGLPLWPKNKPLPFFKSYQEEAKWWSSYDLEHPRDSHWESVEYVPRGSRRPRTLVYQLRLDKEEMARLQALAKRRGVPASVVLRDFIRTAASH